MNTEQPKSESVYQAQVSGNAATAREDHILRAPWGIGSYHDMADPVADLLAAIDCALGAAS